MKFTGKNNLTSTSTSYVTTGDQSQTYIEQKVKNVIKSTKEITHELDLICEDEPLTEAQLQLHVKHILSAIFKFKQQPMI
ncbi:unnamed protein product [Didymodactylos carnosus]|uniref:Uncharacterized protein n=1 Tax=Didymodactylos carnosus TaxID=1234261 RepID=A0A813ZA71_9BILA|nr:unnamed protein product [Didymodactylos carnosus]CAF0895670.1 unnamed protein product [Didymodactylos carnosus]CAF3516573.1 unnamed protein product [Didymodactylos carnosus]CAF3679051.1 unnamed protein product [Didymodactylos carnosus]